MQELEADILEKESATRQEREALRTRVQALLATPNEVESAFVQAQDATAATPLDDQSKTLQTRVQALEDELLKRDTTILELRECLRKASLTSSGEEDGLGAPAVTTDILDFCK